MNKRTIFFTIIIVVCVISIGIAIYVQFLSNNIPQPDNVGNTTVGGQTLTEDEYRELQYNFNNLFLNAISPTNAVTSANLVKIDTTKDVVYTNYEYKEKVEGKYDVNIKIPIVNINNSTVDEINKEIATLFERKANSILSQKEGETTYTIYNVEYGAYVNQGIVSLVIKATLKEGNNPQRVIVKTYNYDVANNKILTIQDMLTAKGLSTAEAQKKIQTEIRDAAKQAQALKDAGYNVYARNVEDEMYQIENTYNYFLGPNTYLYLIYAYGNNNYTTEFDIVIY